MFTQSDNQVSSVTLNIDRYREIQPYGLVGICIVRYEHCYVLLLTILFSYFYRLFAKKLKALFEIVREY